MEIIIRNIKKEDIEKVVDIQIDSWRTAYKGIINEDYLNNMNRKEKIKKREKDYQDNGFIVATVNEKIVGFCRYIDSNDFSSEYTDIDCELCALYVKSTMKRQGIGKKLMKYVINEFKEKGKKKMIIWCLKENEPSKKFYKKMGGKEYANKIGEFGGSEYQEIAYCYELKDIDI